MQKSKSTGPETLPICPNDRALRRSEAARLVGYSTKTLANLSSHDEGPPCRKYRGHVLYLESEVQAWLRGLPFSGGERA